METSKFGSAFLIKHEKNSGFVHAQWNLMAALHHAPPALNYLVTVVAEQRVSHCLLDLQHMPDLVLLGHHQIEYHLLLQLSALPLRNLALVLKSDWQHEALLTAASKLSPSFDVQVFDDVPTALDWLRQAEGQSAGRARVSFSRPTLS